MTSEEENFVGSGTLEIRGVNHDVEISVENDELLTLQVENCETCEQWIGKYDITYIEELTHKTGNFKQFNIFCSMLESALTQSSDSVGLDLLTYEDLKVLREQKLGNQRQRKKPKPPVDSKLQLKRYLIMTYTVEFDQIHYPLPLTFTGSMDPSSMKKQIRQLKKELQTYKRNSGKGNNSLENDYEKVLVENQELREEMKELSNKLKEGGSTANVSKELKVLKKVVQNLENDLLKERSKNQRIMAKKKKEYEELLEEFEELKSTERNFRVRCKSLTEELAILKKNSRMSPMIKNKRVGKRDTPDTTNRSRTSYNAAQGRERTNSNSSNRGRSKTRSVSRNRERSISASSIGRTPSPGFRRFNPSAYIQEREKKRQESEILRGRRRTPSSGTKRSRTPTTYNSYTKPPSAGVNARNSTQRNIRRSSFESDTDSISRMRQKKPLNSGKRNTSRARLKSAVCDSSDDGTLKRHIPRARVTPSPNRRVKSPLKSHRRDKDEDSGEHSIGIAEIDARLEALQRFMSENMD